MEDMSRACSISLNQRLRSRSREPLRLTDRQLRALRANRRETGSALVYSVQSEMSIEKKCYMSNSFYSDSQFGFVSCVIVEFMRFQQSFSTSRYFNALNGLQT